MPDHPLDSGPLDRAAEIRADRQALVELRSRPDALFVAMWRNKSPVTRDDPPRPVLLEAAEAGPLLAQARSEIFLGRLGERPVFSFALSNAEDFGRHEVFTRRGNFNDLRMVGTVMRAEDAALLSYARGMTVWQRDHRFCGRCGGTTSSDEWGHVLVCTDCDARHFPRTDPAMMALIERGDRILLARKPTFPPRMRSILAGFVEPGESLEGSVRREVREEVGLEVTDLRYVRSQPWPFPRSLMLGFYMRSLEGEIRLDDLELEAAGWYTREQIEAGDEIFVPPKFSLAGQLIGLWLEGDI